MNSPCAYQRYCVPKGRVIHTETVEKCPYYSIGEKNE